MKNVIEYYAPEVALRICKHQNGYYYLMCLQGIEGEKTKLYSCYSLVKLKELIERYARLNMTTIFKTGSELRAWLIEKRIAHIWNSVIDEIPNLGCIASFDEMMAELSKVREIPEDPCAGPIYFGIE